MHLLSLNRNLCWAWFRMHLKQTGLFYCAWDKRIEEKTIQDASKSSRNSIISHLQQWPNSLPCESPTMVGCTDVPLVPFKLCFASTHMAHVPLAFYQDTKYEELTLSGKSCRLPWANFSLNQIYSPWGTVLGLGMFIVPFVGCCHSLWGWGEECPRKVSPEYTHYMKLPFPALSERVVEALAACPASAFFFFS